MPWVENWAEVIRADWRATIVGIIQIGADLILAKSGLSHGEWGLLTGGGDHEGLLPFSASTTQRLMKVSINPNILNPAQGHNLPASWRTLYELTKLSDDQWEQGLSEGVINPDMSREDVSTLIGNKQNVQVSNNSGE